MIYRIAAVICLVLFLPVSASAASKTASVPGANISYEGISTEQASAIAKTLAAARTIYADQFKFNMPSKVTADVACAPGNPTRLFNDGRDLAAITGGPQTLPALFAAWQSAAPDLTAPEKKLLPALLETFPDKKVELEKWWQAASPLLIQSRANNTFAKTEIDPARLENKPITLKFDDDAADGKRSIAGGGHALQFDAPAEGEWYLRSVSIHGARYGPAAAPPDRFDIALCDADMHPIAIWHHPYSAFDRGQPKWVKLATPPTKLPHQFNICAVFRPSARSGVFVDFDLSTQDHSSVATPGVAGESLKQGDWMIRVEIDRAKGTDALGGRK